MEDICIGDKVRIVDDGGFSNAFIKRAGLRFGIVLAVNCYGGFRINFLANDKRGKDFTANVHRAHLRHA